MMGRVTGPMTGSLHNHTTFCDGISTPREMAEAAIAAGYTDFGLSGHCRDDRFSLSMQNERGYIDAIRALTPEYADRIRLYCGIEQDPMGHIEFPDEYDYVVGSVHSLPLGNGGGVFTLDNNIEEFAAGVASYDGDTDALVRDYYAAVVDNVRRIRPDVIGHFDLLLKLNAGNRFFDETAPAYRDAALDALDACAATGCVFEVNTGGAYRGYRDFPYLQDFLLERLCALGGRVTVSTDCHDARGIDFGVADACARIARAGFNTVAVWEKGGFVQKSLGV